VSGRAQRLTGAVQAPRGTECREELAHAGCTEADNPSARPAWSAAVALARAHSTNSQVPVLNWQNEPPVQPAAVQLQAPCASQVPMEIKPCEHEAPTAGRVLHRPEPVSQKGSRQIEPGQLKRVGVPLVQLMRARSPLQALVGTKPVRPALQTSSVAPLQRC
jgi:hypothetical protein